MFTQNNKSWVAYIDIILYYSILKITEFVTTKLIFDIIDDNYIQTRRGN